jgi:hypothetical protein
MGRYERGYSAGLTVPPENRLHSCDVVNGKLRLAKLLQKLLRETNGTATVLVGAIVGNLKRKKNDSGNEI